MAHVIDRPLKPRYLPRHATFARLRAQVDALLSTSLQGPAVEPAARDRLEALRDKLGRLEWHSVTDDDFADVAELMDVIVESY